MACFEHQHKDVFESVVDPAVPLAPLCGKICFSPRDFGADPGASPAPEILAGPPAQWSSRGPGGGGAMFSPSFNPANPDEIFVVCDMGPEFHSLDGGQVLGHGGFPPVAEQPGLRGAVHARSEYPLGAGLLRARRQHPAAPRAQRRRRQDVEDRQRFGLAGGAPRLRAFPPTTIRPTAKWSPRSTGNFGSRWTAAKASKRN